MRGNIDTLKATASQNQNRIKELDDLLRMAAFYHEGKPIADKLKTIRFEKSKQKFRAENDDVLTRFYMAERKLKGTLVNGKLPVTAWRAEKEKLGNEYAALQEKLKPLYADTKKLWAIHYAIHDAQHEQERQQSQKRNHEIDR